MESLLYDRVIR